MTIYWKMNWKEHFERRIVSSFQLNNMQHIIFTSWKFPILWRMTIIYFHEFFQWKLYHIFLYIHFVFTCNYFQFLVIFFFIILSIFMNFFNGNRTIHFYIFIFFLRATISCNFFFIILSIAISNQYPYIRGISFNFWYGFQICWFEESEEMRSDIFDVR